MIDQEVKITKRNHHRLNFTFQNLHYSINYDCDGYETVTTLRCKENKDFDKSLCWGEMYVLPYMKKGQTYKNTDLSKLYEIIEKYIVLNQKGSQDA